MDPRWDDLALRCAKSTRALAAWAVCPLGLGLWVVMMAQRPRMMEQLHLIFLVPALLGLLFFALGLCFSGRYISTWGRGRHESRLDLAWGVLSAVGFWCAAAVLVSVCAFSAHTGAWAAKPTLWNAFWNPAFPAVFLTWAGVSISAFGAFGLLYAASRDDSAWRVALVHEIGKWMVAGAIVGVLGWVWWGIRLTENINQNLVIGLVAAAVAAQAVLGSIAYRWGVRDPERRHRRHAGAASLLVVLLLATNGWIYVEAKGNFQIHQYMYRNGMIIEEAEDANRTGLWNFVNLGEPRPAQGELGAFSFRAQCMACHADWVKSQDPDRTPGFRFEGDALRFLGEMRTKHPPYPLLAGLPEERHALAAYLEELITKSGGNLASRPKSSPAKPKQVVRPAVVSNTSPEDAEKPSENTEVSKVDEVEKGAAVPVLKPSDAAQDAEKLQEQEQVGSTVSSTRPSDAQDAETSVREEAIISPAAPPDDAEDGAKALDAEKPQERGDASRVSSDSPDEGQDTRSTKEANLPTEEESAAAQPLVPSNDTRGAGAGGSGQTGGLEDKGGNPGVSVIPPTDVSGAGKSRDIEKSENQGIVGAASPAPLNGATDANSPGDGGGVSAAPSPPPDDSQDAKKQEEKNSP